MEEIRKWQLYFTKYPIGKREDIRTYLLGSLHVSKENKKSWDQSFPSLELGKAEQISLREGFMRRAAKKKLKKAHDDN